MALEIDEETKQMRKLRTYSKRNTKNDGVLETFNIVPCTAEAEIMTSLSNRPVFLNLQYQALLTC